jgi:glutathione peroxidase
MKHFLSRAAILAAPAFLASAALACSCTSSTNAVTTVAKAKVAPKTSSMYDFKLKTLDGKDADLSKYKGKVLLIVNTASKCGHTPQYAGLQKLHEQYSAKGLVVLGFPVNDFGNQEPGSEAEIGAFCEKNFGVKFPLFAKSSVKGESKAPIWKYLTEEANPELKGEIGWNFEKFLIGRDGKLVARFKSGVKPDSPEIARALDTQLAVK